MDQYAKEGKDKKVTFEAVFSKPNSKPKWFLRKDVRNYYCMRVHEAFIFTTYFIYLIVTDIILNVLHSRKFE